MADVPTAWGGLQGIRWHSADDQPPCPTTPFILERKSMPRWRSKWASLSLYRHEVTGSLDSGRTLAHDAARYRHYKILCSPLSPSHTKISLVPRHHFWPSTQDCLNRMSNYRKQPYRIQKRARRQASRVSGVKPNSPALKGRNFQR